MERNVLKEYIDACEVIKDIEKEIEKLKAKKTITANETVSGSNPEYPYNPQHFKVQERSTPMVMTLRSEPRRIS